MSALLVVLAVSLSAFAGAFVLAGYLWYAHASRLHEGSVFPEHRTGVRLLRYGGAAGFATFGGFLFTFVFYLLVEGAGDGTAPVGGSALLQVPFREVAVGLFLLSLATFCVAGAGYATDAVLARFGRAR